MKTQPPAFVFETSCSLSITEPILSIAHNDKFTLALVNKPSPYIASTFETNFVSFLESPSSDIPTCLAISSDSLYVACGYKNGQVLIWLQESRSLVSKYRVYSHAQIKELTFINGHQELLLADLNNNLTKLVLIPKGSKLSIKETTLVHHLRPINDIRYAKFQQIYFCAPDAVIQIDLKSQEFTKIIDLPQATKPIRLSQGPLCLLATNSDMFWIISIENHSILYQGKIDSPIYISYPMTSHVFALILKNGTVALINCNGEICSIIKDPELNHSLKNARFIYNQMDSIYVQQGSGVDILKFVDWKASVLSYAEMEQFELCFQILNSIAVGLKTNYFRVPEYPQDRIDETQQVFRMMTPGLLPFYTLYSSAFALAVSIGLSDILPTFATYCIENNHINDFFNGIFGEAVIRILPEISFSAISQIITLFSRLQNQATQQNEEEENGQQTDVNEEHKHVLDELEMRFCNNIIPKRYADLLLTQALQSKMTKLAIKIMRDCFSDYIGAAKCAISIGSISNYAMDIFLCNNYPIPCRQSVLIFLLDKMDQVFLPLMQTDKKLKKERKQRFDRHEKIENDCPKLFAAMMSLLPIQFYDDRIITIEDLITSILIGIANANYIDASSLVEIICPLIMSNQIEIPKQSIPMIIKWCFAGDSWASQKETLLLNILKQYPGVLNLNACIPQIQNCGFSNIMIKLKQPVSKVVTTMAMCPERRMNIFQYLKTKMFNKEVVAQAIVDNFPLLVVLNPKDTAIFIGRFFTDLHKIAMGIEKREQIRLLYLNELLKTQYRTLMTKQEKSELMRLKLKYSTPSSN